MKPTALGDILVICPQGVGNQWLMLGYSKSGRWQCSHVCATRTDARKQVSKMRAWHKTLAERRALRAQKKAQKAATQ